MILVVALVAVNTAGWLATLEQLRAFRQYDIPFTSKTAGRWEEGGGSIDSWGATYHPADGSVVYVEGDHSRKKPPTPGKRWLVRGPTRFTATTPVPPAPRPFDIRAALGVCAPAVLATAITAVVLAAPFVSRALRAPVVVAPGGDDAPGARADRPLWGRVRPWRLAVAVALVALNVAGVLVSRARLNGPPASWRRLPQSGPYARWCLFGARVKDGLGAHLHYYGNGAIEFRSDFRSDPVTDRVTQRPDWPNHPFTPPPSDADELWRILTPVAATLTISCGVLAVVLVWGLTRALLGRRAARATLRRGPCVGPASDSHCVG